MQFRVLDTRTAPPDCQFDLFYDRVSRDVCRMTPRHQGRRSGFEACLITGATLGRACALIEAPSHWTARTRADIRRDGRETYHLSCMLGGTRDLMLRDRVHRVRRGELFLTDSRRPFCLENGRGRYRGVKLALPCADMAGADLSVLLDPARLSAHRAAPLMRMVMGALGGALTERRGCEVALMMEIATCLLAMAGAHRAAEMPERRPSVTAAMVRLEIQRAYGEADLTLERVAARLGLSVRAVQRLLSRQETSFSALLRRTRMEAAARQLAETPKAIQQIAQDCGYVELASFYRAFKREFALTPAEARARQATGAAT